MATAADDDARANRRYWDGYADEYQHDHGAHLAQELVWGTWAVPEAEVGALGEVSGLDVVELGCGAAQWSTFLAARGARSIGLDLSRRQLAHARDPQPTSGGRVMLVQASATAIPLADDRFDLVFCDHGAMSYADPSDTLPEVARILRPDGRLVFATFTPLSAMCWNEDTGRCDDRLHRAYFGSPRWDDANGFVSFELGYGDWIRVLRDHGFTVDALHELCPTPDGTSSHRTPAERDWARRWPSEHIWCARWSPSDR